jgi:hypothetical protein
MILEWILNKLVNFLIVMYVPFSVVCVLFVCKCVPFHCHRVSTQLQLNKYIYIHIYIIYHIKKTLGNEVWIYGKVEISSFVHIIMNLRVSQNIDSCDESLRDFNLRRRTVFYISNYHRSSRCWDMTRNWTVSKYSDRFNELVSRRSVVR